MRLIRHRENTAYIPHAPIAGAVVRFVGRTVGQAPTTAGPTIVNGLGPTFVIAIVFLCGGSLFFFSRYGIDRKWHAEISAVLHARALAERG